ncbi:MAG: hypothetical protein RBR65_08330 [Aliarcobacter sp.]|jgi:hypothetical protein|nr:hypothetical protein [Aliarcobacter sp.]
MNNSDNEPSLNKIDDYNGNESKQKRNTVRLIVLFCLVVGGVIAYFKTTSLPDDYIGTPDQPGISTNKK